MADQTLQARLLRNCLQGIVVPVKQAPGKKGATREQLFKSVPQERSQSVDLNRVDFCWSKCVL